MWFDRIKIVCYPTVTGNGIEIQIAIQIVFSPFDLPHDILMFSVSSRGKIWRLIWIFLQIVYWNLCGKKGEMYMLCSWYLFSKIKKVFILGDKISISLRSLKIFVLLIAWLHEFPIRNSEQQTIKKPDTDWFKVGI